MVKTEKIVVTGDSPQAVAFALLSEIDDIEHPDDTQSRDRKWLLDTYTECLEAANARRISEE